MLNAEKFRKEISENSNVVYDFSMSKDKHTIKKCLGVCGECFFNEPGNHCSDIKVKWLLLEYKEPIKLSKLEYELLRHLYKKGYSYIVRDGSNSVYVYEKCPCRINLYWAPGDVNHNDDISLYRLSYLFQFLKWSDEEPTLIQDILNNCEVVEDDLSRNI